MSNSNTMDVEKDQNHAALNLDIKAAESSAADQPNQSQHELMTLRRSPRTRTPPAKVELNVDSSRSPNKKRSTRSQRRRSNKTQKQKLPSEQAHLDDQGVKNESTSGANTGSFRKSRKRSRKQANNTQREPNVETAPAFGAANAEVDSIIVEGKGAGEEENGTNTEAVISSAGAVGAIGDKPKRRKRTPYSKKTWQEQMELLDHEAERARRLEEQEQKRLQRLPPLEKLSAEKLNQVRPNAPRNTTQFLIDSHASADEQSHNEDDIEIDEHGTMSGQSSNLLALREELRKSQREVAAPDVTSTTNADLSAANSSL